MSNAGKIVRAVVGLAVLLVLVAVVNRYWGDYKQGVSATRASSATETPAATSSPGSKPAEPSPADQLAQSSRVVVILIDGLNFREQPDATGKSIRGLKKNEQLILVSTNGTWLQVKDPSGAVGWVTNNPQYLKIVKKK